MYVQKMRHSCKSRNQKKAILFATSLTMSQLQWVAATLLEDEDFHSL